MAELSAALRTALEAVALARDILLAECARPDGPRGEIGHCPADDEAERAIREFHQGAFPGWGFLGDENPTKAAARGGVLVWVWDPTCGPSPFQLYYRVHLVYQHP